MTEHNIILSTDSYKLTHKNMYPSNTTKIFSYMEARTGKKFDDTVFFGLQALLLKYLTGVQVSERRINEAESFVKLHFKDTVSFDRDSWEYILDEYNGNLPLVIKAVPEGMCIPVRNILMSIENTDPKCFWLTNHVESILLQLWYSCTVATISRNMKKSIKRKLFSGEDDLPYMLHDFGLRGSTSLESATIGGAAHLVNFLGSDNIPAIQFLQKYYNPSTIPGYSIPAAEHSVITTWGKLLECDAYKNILEKFNSGAVSIVADSWDVYHACKDLFGDWLLPLINTQYPRIVIIRPDSGDPKTVLLKCLEILGEKFGYAKNNFYEKVLPSNIRLMQGDGITRESLNDILDHIFTHGWAAENIFYGSGGGLLQDCSRDTYGFAIKTSWAKINRTNHFVFKNPITDKGKNSKQGRLKLIKNTFGYSTCKEKDNYSSNLLEIVFLDGALMKRYTLEEIRDNAKI